HQSVNAAIALAAAGAFLQRAVNPMALRDGLAAVHPPARVECVEIAVGRGRATVVFDRAHNPDAVAALTRTLRDDLPAAGQRALVLGVLAGRDLDTMVRALDVARYERIVVCSTPTVRGLDAERLAAAVQIHARCAVEVVPDPVTAAALVTGQARHGDQIVVTGCTYHVAALREWLLGPVAAAHTATRTTTPTAHAATRSGR
ncbi:MAG TPA: hypothetical protein PLV68_08365, partial [Ilumatobacteraceae bacterium]|nr:hypothetical protein [Ilumatobacteraceae bacterium]